MSNLIAIAAGGAIGALLRYYVGHAVMTWWSGSFPLGILLCNVSGSFLMGALIPFFAHHGSDNQTLQLFLTAGTLGAFTTFSAFSMEAVMLLQRGDVAAAALYVITSVTVSIAALCGGMGLVRILYG